ncbi:M23 family metallopeptidase [Curvibacter sp. CHRR-16]|uniref:M23 family metallopeptidase n=1 Tax=Curvibacter sp. CHRR-16 TaxID=2835872 RepID=UPI001BDA9AD9|nr:M23 family metallopeptidase [Curvibacter sp. CHRR-16]MBT0569403.1 M23 family metallopeptidase [Curvibacter sp. CHRR-16]
MQIIITDAWMAKSRAYHLSGPRLLAAILVLAVVVMLLSAVLYHWVFLKGARDGWPIIGSMVRLVVKDEFAQRDRYLKENIELLAKRLGEMQVKMTQLESISERVSGLAGLNPSDFKIKDGQGGVYIPGPNLSLQDLDSTMESMDKVLGIRSDMFTVLESRLFEQKIKKMMIPTQVPVPNVPIGSPFGFRIDPITGRSALHTGLDFPADVGTKILAAAGGVVVTQEFHFQYGNMIEIDHGNNLITRYAHTSKVFVKKGDLIKRGQLIAEVGTTGRSTGPHLHFEVLVQGVPQDPEKFLKAGGERLGARAAASAVMER